MEAHVDLSHIEHDDVAVVGNGKLGSEAHRDHRLLAAVDAGEDAEAVAALGADALQRLHDRRFLAVGDVGAAEEVEQRHRHPPSIGQ